MSESKCRICSNECTKCSIQVTDEISGRKISDWMVELGEPDSDEEYNELPGQVCTECYAHLGDIVECLAMVVRNDDVVRSREPGEMNKAEVESEAHKTAEEDVHWVEEQDGSVDSVSEADSNPWNSSEDEEDEEDDSQNSGTSSEEVKVTVKKEPRPRKSRRKENYLWKPRPQNYERGDSYCHICDKTYYDRYELQQHIDRIHAVKAFPCTAEDCDKSFATMYLKNRHLRLTHGIKLESYVQKVESLVRGAGFCKLCQRDYADLARHNDRIHSTEKPFKCGFEDCDRTFASAYLTNRHIFQVHNKTGTEDIEHLLVNAEKRFDLVSVESPTCCMCHMTFKAEAELTEHVKEHSPPERKKYPTECRYECQYCLKKFQRKGSFYRHFVEKDFVEVIRKRSRPSRKGVRQPYKGDPAICQICGKMLKTMYDLQRHEERVHAIAKPFKCDSCKSSFACEAYLKEHQRNHGIKMHVCEVCGYAFHRLSKLNDHQKLHASGKLIKCTKCIKMYRTKTEFEIHFAKHVANQCHLCEKAYTKREYLNRHMKSEHGGLPDTTCKKCNRKFVHPGYYREHEEKCDGIYKPYKPKKKRAKREVQLETTTANIVTSPPPVAIELTIPKTE